MKRMGILVGVALLAAALAGAQPLSVEYVDGLLEMRSGNAWQEVYIGDSVPEQAVLRLSEDGIAELSAGSVTITLDRDGTYSVADLLRSGKQVAGWNLGGIVNSKLNKLVAPSQEGQTAVMGVRGAAQGEQQLEWVDEGEQYLKRGKDLLGKGEYLAATDVLLEGAELAFSKEERQEYLFYAAYSQNQAGNNGRALALLEQVDGRPGMPFFGDYVLLKGRLMIEGLDFEGALALFDQYLRQPGSDETQQVVRFMKALCQQQLGRTSDARQTLEGAWRLDPGSEYGKAAKQMLDSM